MNIRFFKQTRLAHKWIGFVCSVFFLILSVSGILLMHWESLGLDKTEISGKFLPEKYFHVVQTQRAIQSIAVAGEQGNLILMGTDHGLFRSEDGGEHWADIRDGLYSQDIRALATHPLAAGTVYAGTNRGIFKSEDSGSSWTEWFDAASGLSSLDIRDLVVHPRHPDTLLAATGGGLFVSEDGGESWDLAFDGGGHEKRREVRIVRFSAANPDILYVGTRGGIFRSRNGGRNWNPVWGKSVPDILSLVSLNTDPEFIYIASRRGLYKSFNQGRQWIKDPHFKSAEAVFIDPKNFSRVYLASAGRLFHSTNGGDSWEPIPLDPDQMENETALPSSLKITRILPLFSNPGILLTGTNAGLLLSRDGGKHWTVQDLSQTDNEVPQGEMKMDLVKLLTEIHTGRLFGSHFYLLVDLATVGLLVLILSGLAVSIYRSRVSRRKKRLLMEEDLETDVILDIQEKADDLSHESIKIHDMIEHISKHLEKCKTIYMSREKKEIEEIDRHITTLDKKMHHLMQRIGEFEKISQN